MPSATRPQPVNSPPRAVVPMKAVGNKNALNREVGEDGLRDWSYGLLDCFAARRLCCCATFCPCVVYGQNRQRLRHLHNHDAPLPGGGDRFNQDCRVYCCMAVPCFFWVFQMGSRTDVRNHYEIRGESTDDCLASLFCRSCALTQEGRELELEEKSFSSSS